MIEEQYVSFETAKLAKEKRFNEPVCTHYTKTGTIWHCNDKEDFNESSGVYSRPTQSLLARWLREQCNISVEVYSSVFRYQHNIRNIDSTCIGGSDYSKTNGGGAWSSYEEAMEDGLQEALKLLP